MKKEYTEPTIELCMQPTVDVISTSEREDILLPPHIIGGANGTKDRL